MTYRNYLFRTYKTAATKRNLDFNLTFDEFNDLISKDCVYCGAKPTTPTSKRYLKSKPFTTDPDAQFNGIDRIDSSKGYFIDNCVPCCETCNKMKLDHSKEFFLEHIAKIYNFNNSSTTIPKGSTSQANGDGNGVSPDMEKDIV